MKRKKTKGKKSSGRVKNRRTRKPAKAPVVRKAPAWTPARKSGAGFFDFLDLIRRVLISHDLLFLSRQVTYHVATSADLPKAWGDADQAYFVLSKLIEHMIRRSARNTRIAIIIKTTTMRNNPGIEIAFSCADRNLDDAERETFLACLFEDRGDSVSGISLSDCRQITARQNGHLWVDFSKSYRPVYHLIFPIFKTASAGDSFARGTFKYDIVIANYANLRKRFGIKKSQSLVSQIEHYVKTLVRHPIDIVMALGKGGAITTIYESQDGRAESVASRISTRLGSEKFKIGKTVVDISFNYRLSPLSERSEESR